MRRRRRLLAVLIGPMAALAVSFVAVTPVAAAGVVGTGTAASCDEAAFDAAFAGGGTITFNCGAAPVTITFTSPKTLTADTSISGGGLITISGGDTSRLFDTDGFNLTLTGLVLRDGGDFATAGGAVLAINAIVAIVDSSLISNRGEDSGGAVAIGAQDGGEARLVVVRSTFDGNRAESLDGGPMAGGAIAAGAAGIGDPCPPGASEVHVLILNSTFRDNQVGFGFGELGQVLSIGANDEECPASAEAQILYSTFADNPGPELIEVGDGATVSIGANVFGPNISCESPLMTSLGYNVTTDPDCFTATTGDQVVADSMIGPLASNGGPTQTMALLPGSPALDVVPAGTLECGAGLTEDQRASSRPQGTHCDAGAYEQVVLTDTATVDQRDSPLGSIPLPLAGWLLLIAAVVVTARYTTTRHQRVPPQ